MGCSEHCATEAAGLLPVTTTVGIMLSEPRNLHVPMFTIASVEDTDRNWQITDSAFLLSSNLPQFLILAESKYKPAGKEIWEMYL